MIARFPIVLGLLLLARVCGAAQDRPNIVLVVADDLGIGDVKAYGGDRCRIETPNFDRLAREGVRFTDAHATASTCVPSRMAMITGRYAWRYAAPEPANDGPWGYLVPRLEPGTPTLATVLQRAGYRSGYIGKWHLGTLMSTTDSKPQGPKNVDYERPLRVGPAEYGFDSSFILPGSLDMYPYAFLRDGDWVGPVNATSAFSGFQRFGPAAAGFEDHLVLDRLGAEAEAFLAGAAAADKKAPFFLCVGLTAPHSPISPGKAFRGKSALGPYGDLVMETDACLGRILEALDRTGLADTTIVVATSDHGPAPYAGNQPETAGQYKQMQAAGHFSNGSFRGFKFDIYEGAHRVPFLVRWPGKAPAGTVCPRLVGLVDLMATFAGAAKARLVDGEGADSVSFLPLLENPKAEGSRRTLVMTSDAAFAIRRGSLKLILSPGSGCSGQWGNEPSDEAAWQAAVTAFGHPPTLSELGLPQFVQLYNLNRDPAETKNLAESQPEDVSALLEQIDTLVASGRTTPGDWLENDRPVSYFDKIPPFVLAK
jgi:arylsulfatase A-like enzyme